MKNQYNNYRYTNKHSSQRGTSMIDSLEDKASIPHITKKEGTPSVKTLTDKEKAQALAKKFPGIPFFRSLSQWKGAYSPKQLASIQNNYFKHFRIESIIQERNGVNPVSPDQTDSLKDDSRSIIEWDGEGDPF